MPSLVEIGGSRAEDFKISSMYFHYFISISTWERRGPSFEQTLIPFTQGCFVPSLVKIGPMVLEKKISKFANVFSLYRNYLPLEKG